ncbi:Uncharacterized conserved protein [Yersinia nurmii]|uniref:Uncharacterized conserved protein n=1 Tax=Yersinia nurmii TaxID=685706 RepID=A0ABM9SH02_9GAMM|nr:DUF2164 domain-containing protein [Yersinia nurmii]CNE58300.1 Uncharacterized conserved protein [Yersinia nurmii]
MAEIVFNREQTRLMAQKIQRYLEREHKFELGDFEAEFLLDFFTQELGAHYYNQGIADAIAQVEAKMENMVDTLLWLEKPVHN